MKRLYRIYVYLVLMLIGVAPMLSVLISSSIASLSGCRVHEGGPTPCYVLGMDIGEPLAIMFVAGWLMLVSWPFLIAGLLGMLVEALFAALMWIRAKL